MRKKIAAGNWKMNTDLSSGIDLATAINKLDDFTADFIILCPPATHLQTIASLTSNNDRLHIAAQNLAATEKGAYTGEVSASMIKSTGASHVLVGHSERRALFNEGEDVLKAKITQAFNQQLKVIFCLGEPLDIREAGSHEVYVQTQLQNGLFHLTENDFDNIIIAYEPIWAIGTGVTASPEQAESMHAFIRNCLKEHYNAELAATTSILYGGSVQPGNAQAIFGQANVDGGLVGGASLDADSFSAICRSFS